MKNFNTIQGDVDIRQIKSIPKSATLLNTKTIMYGEATGHHHSFGAGQVQVFKPAENDTVTALGSKEVQVQKYVSLSQDTELIHQEHATQVIPKGNYAILQEREWDVLEQQIRPVLD